MQLNKNTRNTYINGYNRYKKTKAYKLNQIFMKLSKNYIGKWSPVILMVFLNLITISI